MRGLGSIAAIVAAALLIGASGGAAAPQAARAGIFTGYGFEACTAPSLAALQALARVAVSRARHLHRRREPRLRERQPLRRRGSPSTLALGWSLLPLYVGLQAPCVGQSGLAEDLDRRRDRGEPGRARPRTTRSRARRARPAGGQPHLLRHGGLQGQRRDVHEGGAVVRLGAGDASCTRRATSPASTAAPRRRSATSPRSARRSPTTSWIANWNGVEDVFGDPYVSDALWPNHQRVHQYKGGHKETYGGVTINIDSDYVDGAVVGGSAAGAASAAARRAAGRLGRLRRRQGDRDLGRRLVRHDGRRDADADDGPAVADRLRRPADGHRSGDVDRRGALRRTGGRPPADADRRARAVVVGRRRRLEAVAQAVVGSVARGCRRGLHARPGRDDRDPDARARLLRPAARHDAAVTGADDGRAFVKGALRLAWPPATDNTRRRRELPGAARRRPPCRRSRRRRGV